MSVLTILEFPDPRLRTKAKPVEQFDAKLATLIDNMFETMYQSQGIGLAATQVNVHKRLMVVDVSEQQNDPMVFINPEITPLEEEIESQEGCLSVPGFNDSVMRPAEIKVNAFDKTGQPFELQASGLLAICIQHENDHLNGKLFVDYLSPLKRQRIRKKLEKQHKQRA